MCASKRVACALAVALTLAATPARSQSVVTLSRQHFFFRAALGAGYGAFWTSTYNRATRLRSDLSIAGGGGMGNFAVGVSIVPRLAVHIDACAMSLVTPTIRINNVARVLAADADSTSTLSIIGGGLTWHTPMAHLWTSLTGGVAVLAVEIPATSAGGNGVPTAAFGLTQLGWGLNLLVGWEWDIAHHWRVGLAVHGIFASIPDVPTPDDAPVWTTLGGGLSLTAQDL